jgi:putative membrane protein
MKTIIRHYAIDTFTLYLVSTLASGIVFQDGLKTLFLAGVGLMIASLLIKPIINILLLPINLITFGLFKWLSSAIALYLVALLVPGLKIERFFYAGMTTSWIDIPQVSLEGLTAFIAFSLLISFITSFFHWLVK